MNNFENMPVIEVKSFLEKNQLFIRIEDGQAIFIGIEEY